MTGHFRAAYAGTPLGIAASLLAACSPSDGIGENAEVYDGIEPQDIVTLIGTEPFWSFEINGESATYATPENPDGTAIAIERFAGNNGLGYSGELDAQPLQITVTPGECSDAMSDRVYPFTATISLGETTLFGCGYSTSEPFIGEEAP